MNIDEVTAYCLGFSSVLEKTNGHPANICTFSVGGKKFAYYKTSEPERCRFSVRVAPERFLELTDQPGVKPAKYLSRFHWVTIVQIDLFDGDYLKKLLEWSYQRAVETLPKKLQAEI